MNRKIIAIGIIGVFLLSTLISSPIFGKRLVGDAIKKEVLPSITPLLTPCPCDPITVDDDRKECPNADYTSIQEAVNAYYHCNVMILVYPGMYEENVKISGGRRDWMELVGINPKTTIINGGGNGNVVEIRSTWVHFKGFTVMNGGKNCSGIYVKGSYTEITNCTVEHNLGNGITCADLCFFTRVTKCNISYNKGDGIKGGDLDIIECNISYNFGDGISIRYRDFVNIKRCIISHNQGNGVTCGDYVNIKRCIISHNQGSGVRCGDRGRFMQSSFLQISINDISYNGNRGIYSDMAFCLTIKGNNIHDNLREGLYIGKIWTDNLGWCDENALIFNNNFINNKPNAFDEITNSEDFWADIFVGNHWSDYKGLDLNRNGVGDIPYIIRGAIINKDEAPIMKPLEYTPPQKIKIRGVLGGIGVKAFIENNGSKKLEYIPWIVTIWVDPEHSPHSIIATGVIPVLPVNSTRIISTGPIFGFGKCTIGVKVIGGGRLGRRGILVGPFIIIQKSR